MMMRCNRFAHTVVLSVGLLTMFACGGDTSAPTTTVSPVSIGAIHEPTTFVDWDAGTTFDLILADLVFHRLARPGSEPGTFVPDLALSWETAEEGSALRFLLRDDRTWEDGTPVTADDVVFSLLRAREGSIAHTKRRTVDVYSPQPNEVIVRFDAPYAAMLADTVFGHIYPRHLLGDGVPLEFHRQPIGSGPYRLERWSAQQAISFVRRSDRPDPAAVERLMVRIFRDKAAAYRELEAGGLDLLRKVQRETYDRLVPLDHLVGYQTASSGYFYLVWNHRRPPWDRPQIRRAMTALIDRGALAQRFEADGMIAEGPLPPHDPRYDAQLRSPGYDPDAAGRVLQTNGWSRNADGTWVSAQGRPLRLELLAYNRQSLHASILTVVADYLRRAGMETDLRLLPGPEVEQRVETGNFDAALYFNPGRIIDLAEHFGSGGERPNRAGFTDVQIDDWVRVGDDANLVRAVERIVDLQPWTFLYYRNDRKLTHRRLQGVDRNPRDPFAVVEQWRIEPDPS